MKFSRPLLYVLLFSLAPLLLNAQTSPPADLSIGRQAAPDLKESAFVTDTITFGTDISGTVITNQYQSKGVIFSGYGGSASPSIYDYTGSAPYGRVLISDGWYSALRMSFVDTLNPAITRLVQNIEFDNPISTEVDYVSIDLYDSMDVLIYHYLSTSPEHVVINLAGQPAAYMVVDDSATTAYVIDNILVDFAANSTAINEYSGNELSIYPNPSSAGFRINSQDQIVEITVTDVCGRVVYHDEPNENKIRFDLASRGLYFASVRSEKGTIIQKIIRR
jgi:hypothetical protein